MAQGDYQINGHAILSPSQGRWVPRRPLDVQGDNRPIYSGVREYELKWRLMSYEDWATLQANFNAIESTGSYNVRLPTFPSITGSSWGFTTYSGCTMAEPMIGPFFESYPSSVVLLITNIVV